MSPRPTLVLVAALIAGCQGKSPSAAPAAGPTAIEVRDAGGAVRARVVPGRPCRATVDGVELLVGGRPLVAMVGAVRWTGRDDVNGTILERDGAPIARIYPTEVTPDTVELLEPSGVALLRVRASDDRARVVSGAGAELRTATRTPTAITVGDLTVTGTTDLLLAAVLSASEAVPEVRGLAACHRLLPTEKTL